MRHDLDIMWLSDYKDEREINCDNLLINDIITIHTNSLNKIILKHEKKLKVFNFFSTNLFRK